MSELSYKNTDFILKAKADEGLIDRVEKYEAFLSALCQTEYYFQKDAIYEVLKYFCLNELSQSSKASICSRKKFMSFG